jgi:hypothetical protein
MAIPFYGDVVGYLVSLRDVYLETLAAERDADALADREAEEDVAEPCSGGCGCGCAADCPSCNGQMDFVPPYDRPRKQRSSSPSITSPAAQPTVVDEDAEVVHSVPPTVTTSAFPNIGDDTTTHLLHRHRNSAWIGKAGWTWRASEDGGWYGLRYKGDTHPVWVEPRDNTSFYGPFTKLVAAELEPAGAGEASEGDKPAPSEVNPDGYELARALMEAAECVDYWRGSDNCDDRPAYQQHLRGLAERLKAASVHAAADARVTERLDAVPDRFRRWFDPEGKK